MSKIRRQYSEEFKREAVRLMTEGGVPLAQVSRDLGVCTSVLGKWKRAMQNSASPTVAATGSATIASATGSKVKAFPGHGVARDEELASAQGAPAAVSWRSPNRSGRF